MSDVLTAVLAGPNPADERAQMAAIVPCVLAALNTEDAPAACRALAADIDGFFANLNGQTQPGPRAGE